MHLNVESCDHLAPGILLKSLRAKQGGGRGQSTREYDRRRIGMGNTTVKEDSLGEGMIESQWGLPYTRGFDADPTDFLLIALTPRSKALSMCLSICAHMYAYITLLNPVVTVSTSD